ncbi:MAG: hypothetical protein ACLTZT_05655 [Butyricimonas faecalis]
MIRQSDREMVRSQNGSRGIHVYNPAFDVTPAELITAIITEKGIAYFRLTIHSGMEKNK